MDNLEIQVTLDIGHRTGFMHPLITGMLDENDRILIIIDTMNFLLANILEIIVQIEYSQTQLSISLNITWVLSYSHCP
jgi:hypothetical protein